MSVPQTNLTTLERFKAAVGGLGHIHLRSRHLVKLTHKPCYAWQVQNWRYAQAVLAMLWFKLGEPKREQALEALHKFRLDPNWGRPIGRPKGSKNKCK